MRPVFTDSPQSAVTLLTAARDHRIPGGEIKVEVVLMKKWLVVGGMTIVALAAVAAGLGLGTYVAFAQDETPTPPWPGSGPRGMMGGRWTDEGYGPMHESMVAAMAEVLDLTAEQLEEKLADGRTMAEIAEAQGLSLEEFRAAMTEARQTAMQAAVEQGLLTQEQYDWMQQRMQGAWGRGGCPGLAGGGMMGWRFQQ